jgi:hypothetical protein
MRGCRGQNGEGNTTQYHEDYHYRGFHFPIKMKTAAASAIIPSRTEGVRIEKINATATKIK